jgi:hypothetical protein
MKIEVDEYGSFIIISINDNKCLCEIEDFLHDDSNFIDDTGYMHVWNKICRDIFGSWFIRSKNIIAESYAIFYPLSRFKLFSDQQINHFHFTADIANLEIERIDSLITERDKGKHGEQLNMLDKI